MKKYKIYNFCHGCIYKFNRVKKHIGACKLCNELKRQGKRTK